MEALKGRAGQTPEEAVREGWKLSYTEEYIAAHRDELEATMRRVLEHSTPFFAYKRHLDATMTLRVYRQLKEITAPTLVATGRDDVLIPAANSEILAREIPNAQLAIFRQRRARFLCLRRVSRFSASSRSSCRSTRYKQRICSNSNI